MIITISGTAGSGKSVTAKLLAEKLNLKHHSTGELMRQMADEKGMSIMEFSKLAEQEEEIDLELDRRQEELGKHEDNFIIDGRLSFHFMPNSIKIYLDAALNTRAKRILEDKARKEEHIDLKDAIENIKERETSEKKRYKEYYNITISKKSFDLVIDTTNSSVEKTVDKIFKFLKKNDHA